MSPTDIYVAALERLCAQTLGGVEQVAARAQVSPANLKQILAGTKLPSGNRRGVGPGLRDKLTAAFPAWLVQEVRRLESDPPPEYAGRPRMPRRVPVVGTAKLGDDGFFEEFSAIAGAGDGHIEIATEDPNAYCLRVRGMSMHPAIRDGWYVLIEPNGTPKEGEYILLRFTNGKKMVKELLFQRPDSIQVMSVNGEDRFPVELKELEDFQAVGAVVSPSKWRPY